MPIAVARRRKDKSYILSGEILGTCFSIGNDLLLTAGHVVQSIQSSTLEGIVGFVESDRKFLKAAPIVEVEELHGDISLIKVEHVEKESINWKHILRWNKHPLNMFDQVRSLGYPHALQAVDENVSVIQRALQGHIVSAPDKFKPVGFKGQPFGVYELSFQASSAMSGSPLLWSPSEPLISGLIIGNSSSKMMLLEFEEVQEKSGEKIKVEQYESLALGIAVRQTEMFDLSSNLLDMTLFEYLESQKLLAD